MLDVVKSLNGLFQCDNVQTDNTIFKLHYKLTVAMLVIFSVVLSGKQYFGEPINCDFDGNGKKEVVNHFCWIFGTFIVQQNLKDKRLPGLGNPVVNSIETIENYSTNSRESYYQWVSIILCLQALFFYIPRYLWINWEGDRMRLLIDGLNGPLVKWDEERKAKVLQYLVAAGSTHNIYAVRYFVCEILNFVNVLSQIYISNWFVSGKFFSYGFTNAPYTHLSALNSAFPKMAKCSYFRYGYSGTPEHRDALCILPLNVLNEKIFLVLWYWMFFLALISGFDIIYRFVFFLCPKFRVFIMSIYVRKIERSKSQFIVGKISFGDFFLLYRIAKNINPIMYQELIMGLYNYLLNCSVWGLRTNTFKGKENYFVIANNN